MLNRFIQFGLLALSMTVVACSSGDSTQAQVIDSITVETDENGAPTKVVCFDANQQEFECTEEQVKTFLEKDK